MKTKNDNRSLQAKVQKIPPSKLKSVRGSGFTYDEGEERTDKSTEGIAIQDSQVVTLPDLGEPQPK
jgi:hypothetical protein